MEDRLRLYKTRADRGETIRENTGRKGRGYAKHGVTERGGMGDNT